MVGVISLLVFGPERLPSAIRSFQRMMAQFRGFTTRMQAELNHELRVKELHEHLKKIESLGQAELPPELKRSLAELEAAAAQVQEPYKDAQQESKKEDDG